MGIRDDTQVVPYAGYLAFFTQNPPSLLQRGRVFDDYMDFSVYFGYISNVVGV